MNKLIHWAAALLLLVSVAGCATDPGLGENPPEGMAKAAKAYVDLLLSGDLTDIQKASDPLLREQISSEQIKGWRTNFPDGEVKEKNVIGYAPITHQGVTYHDVKLEYRFPDKYLALQLILSKGEVISQGATSYLAAGIAFYPHNDPIAERVTFHFKEKSNNQLIYFTLAIVMALFTVVTLVVCLKTPIPKFKWLWMIVIIIGVGKFSVNWLWGKVTMSLLAIIPFSAMIEPSGLFGSLVVSFSIPVGAIAFWIKRDDYLEDESSETEDEQGSEESSDDNPADGEATSVNDEGESGNEEPNEGEETSSEK